MGNSVCVMLAASLHTPVSLDCIFDELDLVKQGIIKDSHITLAYDKAGAISRQSVLDDVKTALGSDKFDVFNEFLKDSYKFLLYDVMDLDLFTHNEVDNVVLRLKEGNSLYESLYLINNHLRIKYEIDSEFPDFKPHLTLARVKEGEGARYLENKILAKVLSDSKVGFEDIVYSEEVEEDKYVKWNITSHHALTRYFRETRVD